MKKLKLLLTLVIALIFATTAFACAGGIYGGDYVQINSSAVNALINQIDGKKSVVDTNAWSGYLTTDAKLTNIDTNEKIYSSSAVAKGHYYLGEDGLVTASGFMKENAPENNYVGVYYADGYSNIAQGQTADNQDLVVEKVQEEYENSTAYFLVGILFSQFDIDYVKEALLSAESVFAVYENDKITKVKIVNALAMNDSTGTAQNEQTDSEIFVVFDGDYNVTAIKGKVESTYEQQILDETTSSGDNRSYVNCLAKEKGEFEVKTTNGKPIIPSWVDGDSNSGGESPALPGFPQIPEISEDYLGDFTLLDETGISALITALNGKTNPIERGRYVSSLVMLNEDANQYQEIFAHRFTDEEGNLYDLQNTYSVMPNYVMSGSVYYADGYLYLNNNSSKIKIAMSKENYLATDSQTSPAISTTDGLISALTSGENITSVKAVSVGETFTKIEIEGNASLYVEGVDGTIIINIVLGEDGNIDMIRFELNISTADGNMVEVIEFISSDVLPTAPSDLGDYILTE